MGAYPHVLAGTLDALFAELGDYHDAGSSEVVGELHAGGVVTPTSLLGRVRRKAALGRHEILGEWNLARLTPSKYAIVTVGGSGVNAVTVGDASPLNEGDVLTIGDVSAGVALATLRTITDITANVVTFDGAAINVAVGDILHVNGTSEIGEPYGTYWQPDAGATSYIPSGGGLLTSGGLLALLGLGGHSNSDTTPRLIGVGGTWDTAESSTGDGSHVALGWRTTRSGGVYGVGSGAKRVAGTWVRGVFFGDWSGASGPSILSSSTCGAPGSVTDLLSAIRLTEAAADNASWQASLVGLTAGAQETGDSGTWASFSMGANGSADGILFGAEAITSGTLSATLKTLFTRVIL